MPFGKTISTGRRLGCSVGALRSLVIHSSKGRLVSCSFYKSEFFAQQNIIGNTKAVQISKEVGWEKPRLQEQEA